MTKQELVLIMHQALAPWHGSLAPAIGSQQNYDKMLAATADKILAALAAEKPPLHQYTGEREKDE